MKSLIYYYISDWNAHICRLLFISFKQQDRYDGSGPALSPNTLPYSVDGYDVVDNTPDPQRTKQAIAQLQQKILKLTEQIKIEQTARDDNVAEYLKLANNADKQQSARIKQVFEKKNQKSAQTIQQLQRKLEHYHRKLREVEHNGIPRQPKDVLRDMHQGLKDVGAKVCAFSVSVRLFCYCYVCTLECPSSPIHPTLFILGYRGPLQYLSSDSLCSRSCRVQTQRNRLSHPQQVWQRW